MIVWLFGSLSVTAASAGGVNVATLEARSPYPMVRVVAWCRTLPDDVEHSDSGTLHVCAAAVTNICRTAAPTRRQGSQLLGVPLLPPVDCGPYLVGSRSACS